MPAYLSRGVAGIAPTCRWSSRYLCRVGPVYCLVIKLHEIPVPPISAPAPTLIFSVCVRPALLVSSVWLFPQSCVCVCARDSVCVCVRVCDYVCVSGCECRYRVFNIIGCFSFIYIDSHKRSIRHAKSSFQLAYPISYRILGALHNRPTYQLVSIYFPTWIFYSICVSVCRWKCDQMTTSYFQMKSTDGQYIVMCMHLENMFCCVALQYNIYPQWTRRFPDWTYCLCNGNGGTACNMEGSCEYIEYRVADSRQRVFHQLGVGRRADNSSP
jgi:hypothetical protein